MWEIELVTMTTRKYDVEDHKENNEQCNGYNSVQQSSRLNQPLYTDKWWNIHKDPYDHMLNVPNDRQQTDNAQEK